MNTLRAKTYSVVFLACGSFWFAVAAAVVKSF